MGKRLVIAEKKSVAEDIVRAIGGFVDEGEFYESPDYVLSWAFGHLLELAEPEAYDKAFRSWALKNLPILPESFKLKPKEKQKKRLDLIRKLARRKDVDGLINACDAGREGELIFRRLLEYSEADKPTERLWLQSMTTDAIVEGFAHLRPGSEMDSLADAAWCRAVGDWLVGMNATRALTQRLKSRGEREAWSGGRVQTPTLSLLVHREHDILAHEPLPYWKILGYFAFASQQWEGQFQDPSLNVAGDHNRNSSHIFDEARVTALMAGLDVAKVGSATEKRRQSRSNAPLLYDLTTLQRESGYSAKRTLDAAQSLYDTHKVLTYPRTDSKHLPSDYGEKVLEVLNALSADVEFAAHADSILAMGPQNLERVLDTSKVSDHFAIIPTGAVSDKPLSPVEARIYEMVCRRFLAAFMPASVWSVVERTVDVDAGAEIAHFVTSKRMLEVPGWEAAYGKEVGHGANLPALPEGGPVMVEHERSELTAHETSPEARYSESTLLAAMENADREVDDTEFAAAMRGSGLGTPATRADIIENLIKKQYVRRVDKRLRPTSKAMRLMDVLHRVDAGALASAELTGQWEFSLAQVQRGELGRDEFHGRLNAYVVQFVEALRTFDHHALYQSEPDLGTCPACNEGKVVESVWGYHCTRNTGADSECSLMIWKDRSGRYIDRKTATALVLNKQVGPIDGFTDRFGRTLTGSLFLEFDDEKGRWGLRTEFGAPVEGEEAEEELGELGPCPEHEGCAIVETNLRYVCRKLYTGEVKKNAPTLPRKVCQREMSHEEASAFFGAEGRTEILDEFVSKRGRNFRGALVRKPTGKHGFEFPPRPGAEAAAEGSADAKTPAAKKAPAKKAPAKKPAAKKPAAKAKVATKAEADAPKPAAKKAPAKKAPANTGAPVVAAKKRSAKKPAAKRAAAADAEEPHA